MGWKFENCNTLQYDILKLIITSQCVSGTGNTKQRPTIHGYILQLFSENIKKKLQWYRGLLLILPYSTIDLFKYLVSYLSVKID